MRRTEILDRIRSAAKWANRQIDDITLVAVSKLQPDGRVQDMLATGQAVFGENRIQEAKKRWGETFSNRRQDIELRLIGPLQTNKAEEAVRLFDVIETVDRDRLVKALVKAADKVGNMPKLLIQVNLAGEPQKSGIMPDELAGFLKHIKDEYNITPQGLMCIPPMNEAASPHFMWLKNMADEHGFEVLSMGMSGDFETAIKQGATHLRVGSALFGDRL